MARPKKAKVEKEIPPIEGIEGFAQVPSAWAVPTPINKLSVDLGREDLNNMAMKINEIINRLNG